MSKELFLGINFSTELTVAMKDTASMYGSGLVEVFATPAMIGMMENTAHLCVNDSLDETQITVGTEVNIQHLKATPIGMKVVCIATLIEIEGKKLVFEVIAHDEQGLIGKGFHTRYIVDRDKFMSKLNQPK